MGQQRKIKWSDIDYTIEELIKIIPVEKYFYITGIPRGGLVPAVMLSHALGIPYTNVFEIDRNISKDVLVVDDISDSGKTILPYMRNGYDVVTLFTRFSTSCRPTYCVGEIKDDKWIIFPWEQI